VAAGQRGGLGAPERAICPAAGVKRPEPPERLRRRGQSVALADTHLPGRLVMEDVNRAV